MQRERKLSTLGYRIEGFLIKNKNIGALRAKLKSLCERYGLNYIEQEESYTSKASSVDRDEIPVYNADNPVKPNFSGRRDKRGLYKTKAGHLINADRCRKFKYWS